MPSLQQTLDQKRAKRAWEDIQKVNGLPAEFNGLKKSYGSLARRVPMLILTNGLGQTLAYLRSKGKDDPKKEHYIIFQQLSYWTMSQVAPESQNQSLLDWVLQTDSTAYRRATAEALAYLSWLKRFAEAELPTEEEE